VHAMLFTLDAGHVTNNHGLELTSIEMPPFSRASVIPRTGALALWTLQRSRVAVLHSNGDLALPFQERIAGRVPRPLFVELDVSDFSGGLKAEDLLVKVAPLHLVRIDERPSTHMKS